MSWNWELAQYLHIGRYQEKSVRKQMTRKRCSEDVERRLWKLIRENEKSYDGQIFRRLTWVYPCGGTVEFTESIDERGNRIYIIERFELSSKSWVEERPIADAGSRIEVERSSDKEQALELAKRWRDEVVPCEVCETEKWTVFKFKTGVDPLRVRKVQVTNQVPE